MNLGKLDVKKFDDTYFSEKVGRPAKKSAEDFADQEEKVRWPCARSPPHLTLRVPARAAAAAAAFVTSLHTVGTACIGAHGCQWLT